MPDARDIVSYFAGLEDVSVILGRIESDLCPGVSVGSTISVTGQIALSLFERGAAAFAPY